MSVYAYASKFNYDKGRDGPLPSWTHKGMCGNTIAVIFNEDDQKLWRCRDCGCIGRHPLLIVKINENPTIKEFTLVGNLI